jgi:CMP-2-keto-3-deoxyoctulosonic acid synthetase
VKIFGIIPARYGSTRFPGKPLALIAGKPLIQHVVEQCQKAKSLSEVIVATDDTRIWEVAQNFCRAEMTRRIIPAARTASPKWRQNCLATPWSTSRATNR